MMDCLTAGLHDRSEIIELLSGVIIRAVLMKVPLCCLYTVCTQSVHSLYNNGTDNVE